MEETYKTEKNTFHETLKQRSNERYMKKMDEYVHEMDVLHKRSTDKALKEVWRTFIEDALMAVTYKVVPAVHMVDGSMGGVETNLMYTPSKGDGFPTHITARRNKDDITDVTEFIVFFKAYETDNGQSHSSLNFNEPDLKGNGIIESSFEDNDMFAKQFLRDLEDASDGRISVNLWKTMPKPLCRSKQYEYYLK